MTALSVLAARRRRRLAGAAAAVLKVRPPRLTPVHTWGGVRMAFTVKVAGHGDVLKIKSAPLCPPDGAGPGAPRGRLLPSRPQACERDLEPSVLA